MHGSDGLYERAPLARPSSLHIPGSISSELHDIDRSMPIASVGRVHPRFQCSLRLHRENPLSTSWRYQRCSLLVQDSSLAVGLPGNSLQEQRERLFDQFRRLKSFYNQSSKMQYFTNLIKVPRLPEASTDVHFVILFFEWPRICRISKSKKNWEIIKLQWLSSKVQRRAFWWIYPQM